MMHNSRFVSVVVAAVVVLGACGGADDTATPVGSPGGMRPASPVEFTIGGADGRGEAESTVAADSSMIAPWFDIDYVLADGLVAPLDDTGYVFDTTTPLTEQQIVDLARSLGVDGDPEMIGDGRFVSWRVGPDDGTAPSLWVDGDGQQYWNYSGAWADQDPLREVCAVSVDSEGIETVENCPESEPPAGVPTADEAEQSVIDLLAGLGVDPVSVEFETYADEWSAGVTVTDTVDGRADVRSWYFSFGADGVVQYAGGPLATPDVVGPYPLVDIGTAFGRLRDQTYGRSVTGGLDAPAIAVDEMPVDELPVDELPVDELPEPESIVVTVVDVEADLWWAWDVDGTVWLLPAYRFIGDDGGWYTVPAVSDEYLIPVDQPTTDGPVPVEPDGPVPVEPDVAPAPDLADMTGTPLADFTAAAEAAGWSVRVVEIDGEPLAVTEDYSETRINVAVETVDAVEVVIRAVTDGGVSVVGSDAPAGSDGSGGSTGS